MGSDDTVILTDEEKKRILDDQDYPETDSDPEKDQSSDE